MKKAAERETEIAKLNYRLIPAESILHSLRGKSYQYWISLLPFTFGLGS